MLVSNRFQPINQLLILGGKHDHSNRNADRKGQMDLLTAFLGVLLFLALALLIGGLSFSGVPGPFWHLPFLGETLEFMDSPVKVGGQVLDACMEQQLSSDGITRQGTRDDLLCRPESIWAHTVDPGCLMFT